MSQARQYELVYIVSPDATEQDITDLHAQVEAIVARLQGEMVKTENWGRRKLAYRIGKHREGTYVLEVFSGTGDLIEPDDGIIAIGSGAPFALSAARALVRHSKLNPDQIVRTALEITADICIFTNKDITVEVL